MMHHAKPGLGPPSFPPTRTPDQWQSCAGHVRPRPSPGEFLGGPLRSIKFQYTTTVGCCQAVGRVPGPRGAAQIGPWSV